MNRSLLRLLLVLCLTAPCALASPPRVTEIAPARIDAELPFPVAAYRVTNDLPPRRGDVRAALPEFELTIDPRTRGLAAAWVEPRGGSWTGYWLPTSRLPDGRLRMRLPLTPLQPVQDVYIVPVASPDEGPQCALVEDPLDTAPLGDRTPVVLIHGFRPSHTPLPFAPERDKSFAVLRALPAYKKSFGRLKYYRFAYRPWMALPDLAREFTSIVSARFASKSRPMVIVAHSMGGLVARYAVADPRLAGRIAGIITLASPHHGSVAASGMEANANIAERIGQRNLLVLRQAHKYYPDSPGMRSLRFDNFDGSIDREAQTRFAMTPNTELARFNAVAASPVPLIVYAAEATNLWGWGHWAIEWELERRALAAFHPSWSTADPIVHQPSASFAGGAVAETRAVGNRSHASILIDPRLLYSVLKDVAALERASRHFERAVSAPAAR